jgi:SAM-dependent methyltransferase
LPFPDATFDVAYAVHVFHLVAGWQNAIAEVRRVLKPRGCLLVDFYGRNPESPIRKIRAHLRALVNARGVDTRRPGSQSDEELRAELDKWGAETRIAEVAQWQETFTPAQIIDALAARIHSETRLIPPEILAAVIPDLRAWAENEFGDLRKEVGEESQFSWLVVGKVSDD